MDSSLKQFCFIHMYDEQYWKGLEQHNMINTNSGIKINQVYAIPKAQQFNQLAGSSSNLFKMIKEKKITLYIDRLQGGIYYDKYDYDMGLLEKYKVILGDKFLGIQMHEWASNYKNDWKKIKNVMKSIERPWTSGLIHEMIKEISVDKNYINLSMGSPEEYSKKHPPQNLHDFIDQLYKLFQLRQKETTNLLLPCDSFYMAPKIEIELGATTLLPEIGAQIPFTRIQIALTRGIAQSSDISWGTYYESWGGKPFSVNFARKDGINEWHLEQDLFQCNFASFGEKGGSSRALQRRLFYYSLFSGAQYLAEEWGVGNTFYDWASFSLTEYGRIKKEFIQFAQTLSQIPKPVTPFAIILPKEFNILDINFISRKSPPWFFSKFHKIKYLDYNIKSSKLNKLFKKIKQVLTWIYGLSKNIQRIGNESHVLTNSDYPDVFNILYEDNVEKVAHNYSYFIDLTNNKTLPDKISQFHQRCISIKNAKQFKSEIIIASKKILPLWIDSPIHWLIASNPKDNYSYLCLFNNNGVIRNAQDGDTFSSKAAIDSIIHFKLPPKSLITLHSWPEESKITSLIETKCESHIPAGGYCILQFE
jgi:hypothetical protein